MDDIEHIENQNKKRLEAIRSRRLLLERVYSRNGRISEKSGLIALSRVIFLFASRFIERPEWPGHDVSDDTRQLWELEWYSALLNALCALLPVIQRAVKDGKLIVRDGLTRAPLGDDSFREWVAIDIAVEVENQSKLFWTESPPEDGMLGKWPDAGLHPLGLFVLEGELIRWAEDAGIATEPEIQRLLTPSPQKSDAENMPSVSKADKSPGWKETASHPDSSEAEPEKRLVGWKADAVENWLTILQLSNGEPDARGVARFLVNIGTLFKVAGKRDAYTWKPTNSSDGREKTLTLKTIQNSMPELFEMAATRKNPG